ncbi:MATE family efflux transporter [Porphyromonas sp. COT-239 OH1446]|uniref:MATE family efflux transporter n=1 Tax=Porphyromonas sp. COT-239 OH1446 TaxID=1515613 RepID=UPI00052B5560|nr:hypothetical protein HQ37_05980 [Porphyromonas sp. COT-239 OH1446]
MRQAKDLTVGSITRHLYTIALPIMGTSFIHMAYSFTDMAWLGRLSSKSVAAVGTISVFMWIAHSIAALTKTGAEVTISQSIGAGKSDEARHFASHCSTISILLGFVVALFFGLFANDLIDLYRVEADVHAEALVYMYITLLGYPIMFLSSMLFGLYNAVGHSSVPFRTLGLGLLLNMILDPLLIHVAGWGVAGAAWATVISEVVVSLIFLYQLRYRDRLFDDFPWLVRLRWQWVWRILKIGTPVAALNVLFAALAIYMGRMASSVGGHIGVATLTTGGQLEALTWNTSQGITTALCTIVGQNWAAGRLERVWQAYRRALGFTLTLGLLGGLFFIFWGEAFFSLIVPEPEAYYSGGIYLRISGYSQIFMMAEITTQGLFYGMGRSSLPAVISIAGNYLRIPLVLLFLSWGWGLEGVWWAISLSSMLKGLAALLSLLWLRKRMPRPEGL